MHIPPTGSIFSALGNLAGTSGPAQPRNAQEVGQAPAARPAAPVQHPTAIRQAAAVHSAPAQASNAPPPANLPRGSLLNIKV